MYEQVYKRFFRYPSKYPQKNIITRLNNSFDGLTKFIYHTPFTPSFTRCLITKYYYHPHNRPINTRYYTLLKYLGDYLQVKFMWYYQIPNPSSPYGKRGIKILGTFESVKVTKYILDHIFNSLEAYRKDTKIQMLSKDMIPRLYEEKFQAIQELIKSKYKEIEKWGWVDKKARYTQEKLILEMIPLDVKKYKTTSISYAMVTSKSFHHKRMVN